MLIERDGLRYLPDVDFTDTWTPYPHHQVVDMVINTTHDLGFKLISERHEISSSFSDLFSVFSFKSEYSDYQYQLGVRNSTAKHFALGFCSGLKVVVCSNLCFNGEFIDFNIHNQSLTVPRINEMISTTALSIVGKSSNTIKWLEQLKHIEMENSKLKLGMYELVAKRAVPPGKLHKLIRATHTEYLATNRMTPYLLQAGVTRMNRDLSLNNQYTQSNKANKVIDLFCTKWFPDEYKMKLAA